MIKINEEQKRNKRGIKANEKERIQETAK